MSTTDPALARRADVTRAQLVWRAIFTTILILAFPLAGWGWGTRFVADPDESAGALLLLILVSSVISVFAVILLTIAAIGPSRAAPLALSGGFVLLGLGLLAALWGRDPLAFPGWLGLVSIGIGALVLILAVQKNMRAAKAARDGVLPPRA